MDVSRDQKVAQNDEIEPKPIPKKRAFTSDNGRLEGSKSDQQGIIDQNVGELYTKAPSGPPCPAGVI